VRGDLICLGTCVLSLLGAPRLGLSRHRQETYHLVRKFHLHPSALGCELLLSPCTSTFA
jgi:hypothetical protein